MVKSAEAWETPQRALSVRFGVSLAIAVVSALSAAADARASLLSYAVDVQIVDRFIFALHPASTRTPATSSSIPMTSRRREPPTFRPPSFP